MRDCEQLQSDMDQFMQCLEEQAYEKKIPLKGTFELTPRCNFNCNMCYIHLEDHQIASHGEELSNEEWLEIARQAKEAGVLYLTLTGGEVFVRPGFRELYSELAKMGFLLQILTNGYCIDEKVMEWLQEQPPYIIRITLYGASNETYERVCGVKQGFDKVSKAIDLILQAGIPFYLVSTVVKENFDDYQAMCEFALEKKVEFRATTAVLQSSRGVDRDIVSHRLGIVESYKEILPDEHKVESLYPPVKTPLDVCGSYRKSFWLTWNGNMQLCTSLHNPAISIKGKGIYEAWEELLEELKKLRFPSECNNCQYSGFCSKCPGVLAAECGNYDKVNKEFCENAKLLYERYCKG